MMMDILVNVSKSEAVAIEPGMTMMAILKYVLPGVNAQKPMMERNWFTDDTYRIIPHSAPPSGTSNGTV